MGWDPQVKIKDPAKKPAQGGWNVNPGSTKKSSGGGWTTFTTETGEKAKSASKAIQKHIKDKEFEKALKKLKDNWPYFPSTAAKQYKKQISKMYLSYLIQFHNNEHKEIGLTISYIKTDPKIQALLEKAGVSQEEAILDVYVQNIEKSKGIDAAIEYLEKPEVRDRLFAAGVKEKGINKRIEELKIRKQKKTSIQTAINYVDNKSKKADLKKVGINIKTTLADLEIELLVETKGKKETIKLLKFKGYKSNKNLDGVGGKYRNAKIAELQLRVLLEAEISTEDKIDQLEIDSNKYQKLGLNTDGLNLELQLELMFQTEPLDKIEDHIKANKSKMAKAGIDVGSYEWRLQIQKWSVQYGAKKTIDLIKEDEVEIANSGVNVDYLINTIKLDKLLGDGDVAGAIKLVKSNPDNVFSGQKEVSQEIKGLISEGKYGKALEIAGSSPEGSREIMEAYVTLLMDLNEIQFTVKIDNIPTSWKPYFEETQGIKDKDISFKEKPKKKDELAEVQQLLSGVKTLSDPRFAYLPPLYKAGVLDVQTAISLINFKNRYSVAGDPSQMVRQLLSEDGKYSTIAFSWSETDMDELKAEYEMNVVEKPIHVLLISTKLGKAVLLKEIGSGSTDFVFYMLEYLKLADSDNKEVYERLEKVLVKGQDASELEKGDLEVFRKASKETVDKDKLGKALDKKPSASLHESLIVKVNSINGVMEVSGNIRYEISYEYIQKAYAYENDVDLYMKDPLLFWKKRFVGGQGGTLSSGLSANYLTAQDLEFIAAFKKEGGMPAIHHPIFWEDTTEANIPQELKDQLLSEGDITEANIPQGLKDKLFSGTPRKVIENKLAKLKDSLEKEWLFSGMPRKVIEDNLAKLKASLKKEGLSKEAIKKDMRVKLLTKILAQPGQEHATLMSLTKEGAKLGNLTVSEEDKKFLYVNLSKEAINKDMRVKLLKKILAQPGQEHATLLSLIKEGSKLGNLPISEEDKSFLKVIKKEYVNKKIYITLGEEDKKFLITMDEYRTLENVLGTDKMQALGIRPDNTQSYSEAAIKDLEILAALYDESGKIITYDELRALAEAGHTGAAAILMETKVMGSMGLVTGMEKDASFEKTIFPRQLDSGLSSTPALSKMRILKLEYYKTQTGLISKMKGLKDEIIKLDKQMSGYDEMLEKGAVLTPEEAKELKGLACAKEALKNRLGEYLSLIDGYGVPKGFFDWLVEEQIGVIIPGLGNLTKGLAGLSYTDVVTNEPVNMNEALETLKGAKQFMAQLDKKYPGLGWKEFGFFSLSLSADANRLAELSEEDRNKVLQIKQAASAFINLAVRQDGDIDGDVNVGPLGEMVKGSIAFDIAKDTVEPAINYIWNFIFGKSAYTTTKQKQLKMLAWDYYGQVVKEKGPLAYFDFITEENIEEEYTKHDLEVFKMILNNTPEQTDEIKALAGQLDKIMNDPKNFDEKGVLISGDAEDVLEEVHGFFYKGGPEQDVTLAAGSLDGIADVSGAEGGLTGLFYNFFPFMDSKYWEAVEDNLGIEEEDSLAFEIFKEAMDLDLVGETFWAFVSQEIMMRALMPYNIYIGLPAGILKGDIKPTHIFALPLWMRFAPMWYLQIWDELSQGHVITAVAMWHAINYLTSRNGGQKFGSVWGRTCTLDAEIIRILKSLPVVEKPASYIAKKNGYKGLVPTVINKVNSTEFAKKVAVDYSDWALKDKNKKASMTLKITGHAAKFLAFNSCHYIFDVLPQKTFMKWDADKYSGVKGKALWLAQSTHKGKEYVLDHFHYLFGLIKHGAPKAWSKITSEPDRMVKKYMKELGLKETPKAVKYGTEFLKNGGSLIFGNGAEKAAVGINPDGTLSPIGEGALENNLKLLDKLNAESNNPFRSLLDGNTYKLTVNLVSESVTHALRITEIRVVEGNADPYIEVRHPSELMGLENCEVTLYVSEEQLKNSDSLNNKLQALKKDVRDTGVETIKPKPKAGLTGLKFADSGLKTESDFILSQGEKTAEKTIIEAKKILAKYGNKKSVFFKEYERKVVEFREGKMPLEAFRAWEVAANAVQYKASEGKDNVILFKSQVQSLMLTSENGAEGPKNNLFQLDPGFGKSMPIIYGAQERALMGDKVFVLATNEDLVGQFRKDPAYKVLQKTLGKNAIGVIDDTCCDAQKKAQIISESKVIFVTWKQMAHLIGSGEVPRSAFRQNANNLVLFGDEADMKMIAEAMTAYIVSSPKDMTGNPILDYFSYKKNKSKWEKAYKVHREIVNVKGEAYFKDGVITEKGWDYIRQELKISSIDKFTSNMFEKFLIADQLYYEYYCVDENGKHMADENGKPVEKQKGKGPKTGEEYKKELRQKGEKVIIYSEKHQYEVEGKKIYLVIEGQRQELMTFGGGLNEALRLRYKFKLKAEHMTVSDINIKQVLQFFDGVNLFSGTNIENYEIINKLYSFLNLRMFELAPPLPRVEVSAADLESEQTYKAKAEELVKSMLADHQKAQKGEYVGYAMEDDVCGKDGSKKTVKIRGKVVFQGVNQNSPKAQEFLAYLNAQLLIHGLDLNVSTVYREPWTLVESSDAAYELAAKNAIEVAKEGRGVLIHVNTLKEAKALETKIKAMNGGDITVNILTGGDKKAHMEKVIDEAGKPKVVTISTRMGRGTDTKADAASLMEASMALSGLDLATLEGKIISKGMHVIDINPPNLAQNKQRLDRGPRMAKPGSGKTIISKDHEILQNLTETERAELFKGSNLTIVQFGEGRAWELIDLAYHRAYVEAYQQIVELFSLGDMKYDPMQEFNALYDGIQEGNSFVEKVVRRTVDLLFSDVEIDPKKGLTKEAVSKLELKLYYLLGNRKVDLSGLVGAKDIELVKKLLTEKIYKEFADSYQGRAFDKEKSALVKKHEFELKHKMGLRWAEFLDAAETAKQEKVLNAPDGEARMKQKIEKAYEKLMKGFYEDVFKWAFPSGAKKLVHGIYNSAAGDTISVVIKSDIVDAKQKYEAEAAVEQEPAKAQPKPVYTEEDLSKLPSLEEVKGKPKPKSAGAAAIGFEHDLPAEKVAKPELEVLEGGKAKEKVTLNAADHTTWAERQAAFDAVPEDAWIVIESAEQIKVKATKGQLEAWAKAKQTFEGILNDGIFSYVEGGIEQDYDGNKITTENKEVRKAELFELVGQLKNKTLKQIRKNFMKEKGPVEIEIKIEIELPDGTKETKVTKVTVEAVEVVKAKGKKGKAEMTMHVKFPEKSGYPDSDFTLSTKQLSAIRKGEKALKNIVVQSKKPNKGIAPEMVQLYILSKQGELEAQLEAGKGKKVKGGYKVFTVHAYTIEGTKAELETGFLKTSQNFGELEVEIRNKDIEALTVYADGTPEWIEARENIKKALEAKGVKPLEADKMVSEYVREVKLQLVSTHAQTRIYEFSQMAYLEKLNEMLKDCVPGTKNFKKKFAKAVKKATKVMMRFNQKAYGLMLEKGVELDKAEYDLNNPEHREKLEKILEEAARKTKTEVSKMDPKDLEAEIKKAAEHYKAQTEKMSKFESMMHGALGGDMKAKVGGVTLGVGRGALLGAFCEIPASIARQAIFGDSVDGKVVAEDAIHAATGWMVFEGINVSARAFMGLSSMAAMSVAIGLPTLWSLQTTPPSERGVVLAHGAVGLVSFLGASMAISKVAPGWTKMILPVLGGVMASTVTGLGLDYAVQNSETLNAALHHPATLMLGEIGKTSNLPITFTWAASLFAGVLGKAGVKVPTFTISATGLLKNVGLKIPTKSIVGRFLGKFGTMAVPTAMKVLGPLMVVADFLRPTELGDGTIEGAIKAISYGSLFDLSYGNQYGVDYYRFSSSAYKKIGDNIGLEIFSHFGKSKFAIWQAAHYLVKKGWLVSKMIMQMGKLGGVVYKNMVEKLISSLKGVKLSDEKSVEKAFKMFVDKLEDEHVKEGFQKAFCEAVEDFKAFVEVRHGYLAVNDDYLLPSVKENLASDYLGFIPKDEKKRLKGVRAGILKFLEERRKYLEKEINKAYKTEIKPKLKELRLALADMLAQTLGIKVSDARKIVFALVTIKDEKKRDDKVKKLLAKAKIYVKAKETKMILKSIKTQYKAVEQMQDLAFEHQKHETLSKPPLTEEELKDYLAWCEERVMGFENTIYMDPLANFEETYVEYYMQKKGPEDLAKSMDPEKALDILENKNPFIDNTELRLENAKELMGNLNDQVLITILPKSERKAFVKYLKKKYPEGVFDKTTLLPWALGPGSAALLVMDKTFYKPFYDKVETEFGFNPAEGMPLFIGGIPIMPAAAIVDEYEVEHNLDAKQTDPNELPSYSGKMFL